MSDDPFPPSAPIDAQFEPASPAPERPVKARGPGWMGLAAASLVAALLGGAIGVWGADYLRPATAPLQITAALGAERARIDALQAGAAAMEARLNARIDAQGPPALSAGELAALLGELETASRRLDAAMASSGAGEAFETLSRRVGALERGPAGAPAAAGGASTIAIPAGPDPAIARRAEAALALAAIEAAARRGIGFEADYRALRAAAPENETVRRLGRFIEGVPTLQSLQADFPAARDAAAIAGAPPPSKRLGWLDAVFGDSVSVRPAGASDETAKALGAAERALSAGDLAGAADALTGLGPDEAEALASWTRAANQRIRLEAALDEVRLGLIDGQERAR